MAANCESHPFEMADNVCKSCGYDYCNECLVYPHGEKKPAFCVPCALAQAGVRSKAKRAARPAPASERRGWAGFRRRSVA